MKGNSRLLRNINENKVYYSLNKSEKWLYLDLHYSQIIDVIMTDLKQDSSKARTNKSIVFFLPRPKKKKKHK